MTTTDPRRVPHTGPGHASGDPGWCEGCAAALAADRAEKEARAAPPTDPHALLSALLADVDPADWFSKDELVGMLEHHGADPDRIVPDALLMHFAPDVAAALTAVLDALDDLDAKHQIHGHECLCGFTSARSRSRTEHLTAVVRTAITDALGGDRG